MAGPVVEDHEDLPTAISLYEELKEAMERVAVEDRCELVSEARDIECDRSVDMCCLAKPVRVRPRLHAHAAPRLMERSVEPEARFVFEDNYASAGAGFFLIAGKVLRSHMACLSRSARASRFRGR